MRQLNISINQRLDEALAEARAIKYAVIHKAISYEEAKTKADNLLLVVNRAGKQIAKKYRIRYKKITFTDL